MGTRKPYPATVPMAVGLLAILLLIGVIGYWSVTARIAGAVIASGMIQVENNRQVVQHPQGGVVGEIRVKDGDRIAAGDIMVRLDDTLLKSDLAITTEQLFEVTARKLRLEAERDDLAEITLSDALEKLRDQEPAFDAMLAGQERLFSARSESRAQEIEQISEQIEQVENQIAGIEAQLKAFSTQEDLIAGELKDQLELKSKGLIQSSRVLQVQREQARLLGEIGNLTARVAQFRGEIAALKIQQLRLRTARREEAISTLRDLGYRETELQGQKRTLEETLSRMDIRAPAAGVVYDSQVFAVQSVIQAGAPIAYIIPQDQPLVVNARIEAIHIDQVHVGQAGTLRFTAFDQRLTPEIFGKVTNISADVFTDEVTGVSYYQAEMLPNDGELTKLEGQELLPGMPVEAFIKTAERSPLSYLVKPLADYFNRAFRES